MEVNLTPIDCMKISVLQAHHVIFAHFAPSFLEVGFPGRIIRVGRILDLGMPFNRRILDPGEIDPRGFLLLGTSPKKTQLRCRTEQKYFCFTQRAPLWGGLLLAHRQSA